MKLHSYSLLVIILFTSNTFTMENPATLPVQNNAAAQRGWLESWLPNTFDNADILAEALRNFSKNGTTVHHDLKDFTHDMSTKGVNHTMKMSPESIQQLQSAGNSMVKTWMIAGAGGALTLGGLILLLYTLMKPETTDSPDKKELPWYHILANRYVISALLMASGLTLILTSDRLVGAAS